MANKDDEVDKILKEIKGSKEPASGGYTASGTAEISEQGKDDADFQNEAKTNNENDRPLEPVLNELPNNRAGINR